MATRFQQRRGTSAQWNSVNPVLADGEMGYEKDTGVVKMGNGSSTWVQLSPILGSSYLPMLGKAADSERLDGLDSTAFLLATGKAVDADKLDGIDSTGYWTKAEGNGPGRDRGSGTAFPTTDLRRGDFYDHRGINCLFVYTGTTLGWRQAHTAVVADNAARATMISAYGSLLPDGFKLYHTALKVEQTWEKAAGSFRFRLYDWGQYTTDGNGLVSVTHNGGQVPRNFPMASLLFSTTESQNGVLKWIAWSGTTSTQFTFRAYRTDTMLSISNPGLGMVWSCDF